MPWRLGGRLMVALRLFLLGNVAAGLKQNDAQTLLSQAAAQWPFPAGLCKAGQWGNTELVFGSRPLHKFFTYDTVLNSTWSTLAPLSGCLQSTSGLSWLGGHSNLLDASKAAFQQLGATINVDQWVLQGWLERRPIPTTASILVQSPQISAPMSSFAAQSFATYLQQPCSAVSNAAFFELSLQVCSNGVPAIGGWAWRDELSAAGALMAFGSFAMHSSPIGHTAKPSTAVRWASYDTSQMDKLSMDVLFYLTHQALTRTLSASPGLIGNVLNFGTYQADARTAVQQYTQLTTQDPSTWYAQMQKLQSQVPDYIISSAGLVLVLLNAILNPAILGSLSSSAYYAVCSTLAPALLPVSGSSGSASLGTVQAAINQFCAPSSSWVTILRLNAWRAPTDVGVAMQTIADVLELLVEAMYFQEVLLLPDGYLNQWVNLGIISQQEQACWKVPHATWHRVASQMIKKLVNATTQDIPSSFQAPPLAFSQIQATWTNADKVAVAFQRLNNTLGLVSSADKVNLCSVFDNAKATASAYDDDQEPIVNGFLDVNRVAPVLNGLGPQMDPLPVKVTASGIVTDPTATCTYSFSAFTQTVQGLRSLNIQSLDIATTYMQGNTWNTTAVRRTVKIASCDVLIQVSGQATIARTGGISTQICMPFSIAAPFTASLQFNLQAEVTVDANLNGILTSASSTPFMANVQSAVMGEQVFSLQTLQLSSQAAFAQQALGAAVVAGLETPLATAVKQQILNKASTALLSETALMGRRVHQSAPVSLACVAVLAQTQALWNNGTAQIASQGSSPLVAPRTWTGNQAVANAANSLVTSSRLMFAVSVLWLVTAHR